MSSSSVIENQVKGELTGSIGLFGFAELGFVLPVVIWEEGDNLGRLGTDNTVESFTLADLRIVPKLQFLDPEDWGGFGLGVVVPVYLPIGDQASFNSDGEVRVEPRLIVDYYHDVGFGLSANVGYQFRPERTALSALSDDTLRWGVGLELPTGLDCLQLVGSIFGNFQLEDDRPDTALRDYGDNRTSPIEALGALQFNLPASLVANVGGGAGLNDGVGAPRYRAFASLSYTPRIKDSDADGIPDPEDTCPEEPEDMDGFEDNDGCPDVDNDQDGILDENDTCPLEPEDKDGFEDEDGCPDPDNDKDGVLDVEDQCPMEPGLPEKQGCPERDKDGDGILDEADRCPTEPEDKDGFEDEDGCPDPDNDKDGILDVNDKCPLEPELVNGIEDEDGCPELDTDGDGIIDPLDKCVTEPETYNGNKDDDGCPDGKQTVVITETSIKILERVFFDTNKAKIKSRSFNILNTVATVLKQNPQITLIRIEGHTDDVGGDENNLALSKDRAASVMAYLISQGVKADVLTSEGYGETKPLCQEMPQLLENKRKNRKAIEDCRADNRRVEFSILEVNGKRIDATDTVKIKEKKVVEEPVKPN